MYASVYVMKRTTVYLNRETDLELVRMARKQGRAKTELVREALQDYVGCNAQTRSLPWSVGIGHSGMPDLAERDEELLGQLFEEEHERTMADWNVQQKARKRGL